MSVKIRRKARNEWLTLKPQPLDEQLYTSLPERAAQPTQQRVIASAALSEVPKRKASERAADRVHPNFRGATRQRVSSPRLA
ncbi:hypothetical protein [Bradyrhizobium sp. CCBAU 11361]|uniref:hypothetical protein n=1 Tax=Bradyrhizobium sp. CCBAU 11361 TaxID=1630812 RepID=UPI003FA4B1AB